MALHSLLHDSEIDLERDSSEEDRSAMYASARFTFNAHSALRPLPAQFAGDSLRVEVGRLRMQ